ncbi:hypothetical protein FLA4_02530 [Candidatus Rickettsia kotlanii]|nr:hypothetical protein FLA4_02530 [Candidatus Rickettsia kotlanii]BDU61085.1 hypothetical protein HM2_02530 [Candidatus Rickettsia kotlanii]
MDIEQIVRSKIQEIGYNNPNYGFGGSCRTVISAIIKQSPDIAMSVDNANDNEIGAED